MYTERDLQQKSTDELLRLRAWKLTQSGDLLDKAEKQGKRSLSKDDDLLVNELWRDADTIGLEIRKREGVDSVSLTSERSFRELISELDQPTNRNIVRPMPRGHRDDGDGFDFRANPMKADLRTAFNRYLLDGTAGVTPAEYRALQMDVDTAGGYLVAPQQFVRQLIGDMQNELFALKPGFTTVIECREAHSLGVPSLDTDIADSEWTSEILTGSEDSSMAFGKRELNPHPLAKRLKVSNKLLRTSELAPETLVRSRMAYKSGVALERTFMTGTGSNQPLGVFTASDDGISTSRDVVTGNATAITSDGLIDVVGAMQPQYLKNATWIFHRDAIKRVRKLKDGDGQYIWSAGIGGYAPSTILDRPYIVSEYCPNTFTNGLYVGILGDFRYYWWALALQVQIQKLIELYAESNQTGFISRMEIDGMPVDQNAFVRVKCAAA